MAKIDLLESLAPGRWLKLPFATMRDVGPAVQTLGGLLSITRRETFVALDTIADAARLPVGTVRKHLKTLMEVEHEWIIDKGREVGQHGKLRRTSTIAIARKTLAALEPEQGKMVYGALPLWACEPVGRIGKPPWSAKAVFSVVVARLMGLKAAAENEDTHLGEDDFANALEKLGANDRFRFSLKMLVGATGLRHESITSAKQFLHEAGIVKWYGKRLKDKKRKYNGVHDIDYLVPTWKISFG